MFSNFVIKALIAYRRFKNSIINLRIDIKYVITKIEQVLKYMNKVLKSDISL